MPQKSAARIVCVATVFFCLLLSASFGDLQDDVLTLEFTVSNAAPVTREVDVNVDLPKGLQVDDFVTTDGLDLSFQQDRQAYAVTGKVVLQAGETTLYRIQVKDIWMIEKKDLDQYRSAAAGLPDLAKNRLLDLLAGIERSQEQTRPDVKARIAAYHENKSQLREFDSVLIAGGKTAAQSALDARFWFYGIAAAVIIAALFLLAFLKYGFRRSAAFPAGTESFRDRRKADRIINPPDVECRLLASQEEMPLAEDMSVSPRDLSEGGICLELPHAYRSQAVIELRMKLPGFPDPLTFRGSVMWQKKVVGADSKTLFMTGIQLGEATYEDYEKLREYVQDHTR